MQAKGNKYCTWGFNSEIVLGTVKPDGIVSNFKLLILELGKLLVVH